MAAPYPTADDDLEVTVRCGEAPEVFVRLHSRIPDEYGIGFSVDARTDGLHARLPGVEVWVWDDARLPDFIGQLATDYRGWSDERIWRTNCLTVRATFHSGGHVGLTWDLHPWSGHSGGWQASITTVLEAGEQMGNLAADLREFLPIPRGNS